MRNTYRPVNQTSHSLSTAAHGATGMLGKTLAWTATTARLMARAVASGRSPENGPDGGAAGAAGAAGGGADAAEAVSTSEASTVLETETDRAGSGAASTQWLTSARDGRHHQAGPRGPSRRGFSAPLAAAAVATGGSALGLLLTGPVEWIESWRNQADLYLSLWILLFILALAALWTALALARAVRRAAPADGAPGAPGAPLPPARLTGAWTALLFAVCLVELLTHSGARNGFLASSRPESGVEAWTAADGYATLLDGIPAQGDGLFLLPMLRTFLDEGTPGPSEYDRRAGHTYLVSLLQRPFGTYWGFAVLNLLAWWGAALGVWWLGRRYWPGTLVPWIGSLLVATGGGFVFMGAAPQPHAVAFGAFVLLLALAEALAIWEARPAPLAGAKLGWATGAMGLIYFVHFPALLYYWLYGLASGRARPRRLLITSAVAVALLFAWQAYASALLNLTFAGGNNEYAGEAVRSWIGLAARGPEAVLGQLHGGSLRGILAGAFPYLVWALALLGLVRSPPESRVWALAVLVAATLPAIAFTTRFQLPRLAYFAFPAVYLLAAAGVAALASWLGGGSRRGQLLVAAGAVLLVAALANVDLAGSQRFNVWFHYGMGNAW